MPNHEPRGPRAYAALAAWIAVACAAVALDWTRRQLAAPRATWRPLALAALAVALASAVTHAPLTWGPSHADAATAGEPATMHAAGVEAPADVVPTATADALLQPGHYSDPRDDATVGPPMLEHAAPGGPDNGTMPGWLPGGLARWWPDIVAAAHEHGLDSHAWGAIVAQENPWGNPAAVSPAGAFGLSQTMPATAAGIEDATGLDCRDPGQQLRCGAWYYAARVRDAGDLWQSPADDEGVLLVAAAAYNGGGSPASDVRAAVQAGAGDVCAGVRYSETKVYCYAFRDRWRQTMAERAADPTAPRASAPWRDPFGPRVAPGVPVPYLQAMEVGR